MDEVLRFPELKRCHLIRKRYIRKWGRGWWSRLARGAFCSLWLFAYMKHLSPGTLSWEQCKEIFAQKLSPKMNTELISSPLPLQSHHEDSGYFHRSRGYMLNYSAVSLWLASKHHKPISLGFQMYREKSKDLHRRITVNAMVFQVLAYSHQQCFNFG